MQVTILCIYTRSCMQWVTLYCNFSFTVTVYTDDYRAETWDHTQLSTAAMLTAQVMSKVRVHLYKIFLHAHSWTLPSYFTHFILPSYSEEVAKLNTDGVKHYRITPLTIELRPETSQVPNLWKLGFLLNKDQVQSPHRASIYTLPETTQFVKLGWLL